MWRPGPDDGDEMTANKRFKRRVRDRMGRTGESYTAALRHLRHLDARERQVDQQQVDQQAEWQRFERPDFGYAIRVPGGWTERRPNLKNSPWETGRYVDPTDHRRSVVVFRQPIRPGRTAGQVAEVVLPILEGVGFGAFSIEDVPVGGRPGARLNCSREDAGRVWAVREYFVVRDTIAFCVGCGTSIPDEDDPLFARIVDGFDLLDAG